MSNLTVSQIALRLSSTVFAVTLLFGCGNVTKLEPVAKTVASGSATYESSPDAKGAFTRLVCGKHSPFLGTCDLYSFANENRAADAAIKTQFNLHQKYLLDLITTVVSGVAKNPNLVKKTLTSQRDAEAVKSLNPSEANCKADAEMADLLLVCEQSNEKPHTLILFVRGLCDRCNFEPVVMRKK
jgi:hypothetical protein